MKYLSFVRMSEKYRALPPPPELMQEMGKFAEKSMKEGVLLDTGGLAPSERGFRIRLSEGKVTVTDGPFIDTKEIIGGWAILQGDTKEDVLRTSMAFVHLHKKYWPDLEMECEVRLIAESTKH